MSCTDVVTENCDDADLFVSLDTRDLEQADLIELVANATLRYVKNWAFQHYLHISIKLWIGRYHIIYNRILGGPHPLAGSEEWPHLPP